MGSDPPTEGHILLSARLQHGITRVRLCVAVEMIDVALFKQRKHTLHDMSVSDNTERLMRCGCHLLVQKMDNTLRSVGKRLAARRTKRGIL